MEQAGINFFKIADFDAARRIGKDEPDNSKENWNWINRAPELIKPLPAGSRALRPPSYPVDWYSLGVVLFNLAEGKLPFDNSGSDRKLVTSILSGFNAPSDWKLNHGPFIDLVTKLLQVAADKRLGSSGSSKGTTSGAIEVKSHPFFKCINEVGGWAILESGIAEAIKTMCSKPYKAGSQIACCNPNA